MRFMVVVPVSGPIVGVVTRTKTQAFKWLEQVVATTPLVAWRYHDGNGWADGTLDAHEYVIQLPRTVQLGIYL